MRARPVVGDIGTVLILDVHDQDTLLDLTGASNVVFALAPPDGADAATTEHAGAVTAGGALRVKLGNVWTEPGDWSYQATYEKDGDTFSTHPLRQRVARKL